ncbi:unnamed protein product [Rotaria magnacalcarata]|uniref:Uncharacterized protein n=1 Tax=Rotaria magnacalcarata TaxID=392030 RepID=A0A8S3JI47_9BILA|nr:unnamed protein product [Rotaria magnacalcarata]
MQIQSQRVYPNVRALQIYQNAIVPVNYSTLLLQLQSMLHLNRLVHLELFIPLPTSSFLVLLKSTPCLRNFKTDYDILTVNSTPCYVLEICNSGGRRIKIYG